MSGQRYGFRILGALHCERRLVNWLDAFTGHAHCDPKAEVTRESYLSAFTFGDEFKTHIESSGSTRGYNAECFARWLWFDIDADNISSALADARKLASAIEYRYGYSDCLAFFSGSKGFHIGLPSSLWNGEPSVRFNRYAKAMAIRLAQMAKVAVDESVYDKVRAFRSPNSRHPRTGLHKRILTTDELMNLRCERIVELAKTPEPFDTPIDPPSSSVAVADWNEAITSVEQSVAMAESRRQSSERKTALNRATLQFIQEGADVGNRHPALFAAAANLAEFGCSFELAYALLSEAALDSGLSPSEVRRQIECGLKHFQGGTTNG